MTVRDTALLLANEHIGNQGTEKVLWAPDDNEVRLVEVSTSVEDRDEVFPFRFSPDHPDVPYESVVILLGPGDWERVKAKKLALPEGFNVDNLELLREASSATGS